MCIEVHTRKHARTHAQTHTHTNLNKYWSEYTHTRSHRVRGEHVCRGLSTRVWSGTHAHTHTRTRTHTHTHTHTRTHTLTHMHAHTHTRTYKVIFMLFTLIYTMHIRGVYLHFLVALPCFRDPLPRKTMLRQCALDFFRQSKLMWCVWRAGECKGTSLGVWKKRNAEC